MTIKSSKICVLFLLSIIMISSSFIPPANASSFGPTLSDVIPNRATPGQVVKVLALSYSTGSEIVFYQGATEKIRITLSPAPPSINTNSFSSVSLPSTLSTEFTFTAPSLEPDLYTVRLEHIAELGVSDPVPFAILPVVTGISPLAGNHLTRIEITGTGFQKDERQDIVRFSRDFETTAGTATESKLQLMVGSIPRLPVGTYEIQVFLKTGQNLIENSYASSLKRNFVLHPHLNAISPNSGNLDSMLAVAGIYFNLDLSKIRISFYHDDKKLAEILPVEVQMEGSLLLARVPPQLAPGVYTIKVSVMDRMNPGKWIESDNFFNFTVTAPPPAPPTPQPAPADPSDNEETPAPPSEEDQ